MEGKNFERFGWHFSAEGLALCRKRCEETKSRDVGQVALEMDLRSVGSPSLTTVGSKGKHHIQGPLILQIQKVKNVALSLSKQNSSSGKRFLRIELTDGHTNISAVELQGPIDQLSLDTPPGTKIKIKGSVEVANGFMLLTKSTVEVLGGKVERLLKKWSTTKAVPDNIGREKEYKEDGPPQFVKLGRPAVGGRTTGDGAAKRRPQQPAPNETSTRQKMELPPSYFSESAPKKKEDAASSVDRHHPHLLKDKDSLSSQMKNLSLELEPRIEDIENIVKPNWKDRKTNVRQAPGHSSIRTGSTADSQSNERSSRSNQFERERTGRGRGRGRGRHRDSEDYEDYQQPKRRDFQLFDFFDQRENPSQGSSSDGPPAAKSSVTHEWSHEVPMETGLEEFRPQRLAVMGEGRKESNIGRGRGRGRGRSRERQDEKYWSSTNQPEPTSVHTPRMSAYQRDTSDMRTADNCAFRSGSDGEGRTRTGGMSRSFTAHSSARENSCGSGGSTFDRVESRIRERKRNLAKAGTEEWDYQASTQSGRRGETSGRNRGERQAGSQENRRAGQGRGSRTSGGEYKEGPRREHMRDRGNASWDESQAKVYEHRHEMYRTKANKQIAYSDADKREHKQHAHDSHEATWDGGQVGIHGSGQGGYESRYTSAPSHGNHNGANRTEQEKDSSSKIVGQEWSFPNESGKGEGGKETVEHEGHSHKTAATSGGGDGISAGQHETQIVAASLPKVTVLGPPSPGVDEGSPWEHLYQTAAVPASAKRKNIDLF